VHRCKPDDQVLENRSFPAESWRIKDFRKDLLIGDVLACAGAYPASMERWVRPSSIQEKGPDVNSPESQEPEAPRE
jgi:hypothetical protein